MGIPPRGRLKRKFIEIFFDLKSAKELVIEQKIIKVPNTDVFRIASPILISRGISRIKMKNYITLNCYFSLFIKGIVKKVPIKDPQINLNQ